MGLKSGELSRKRARSEGVRERMKAKEKRKGLTKRGGGRTMDKV